MNIVNDVSYVINTLGRVNNQITHRNLPPVIKELVHLSVQAHEANQYDQEKFNLIVLPEHIKDLPTTRQWLIDNVATRYLVIMDDDLRFFHRRPPVHTHLHKNEMSNTYAMFDHMLGLLKSGEYAMVGISAREGNNRVEEEVKENTRSMRIFGLDLSTIKEIGARFDRTKTKEDMDMTLQILRSGHKNAVIYRFSNDHVSSNAPGGCANYRTLELMAKDAEVLAALHPGFVRVVEKQTKTSWNGQARIDVVVQWKKAYESSKSKAE